MSKLKEKTLVTLKEGITVDYPFSDDLPLVYLGELANMPEHGIFIGQSGKCYFGYHLWDFRELREAGKVCYNMAFHALLYRFIMV
jgi:hypothetical protein